MMQKQFEVRDPIHGMIPFSPLERDVINSAPFQRLRRIRQLAWTDYVYPGAMHTRFQHTIGVMHTASRAFDTIVNNKYNREILDTELNLNDHTVERQRIIIRLAALAHDLGHSPFSHAGEGVFPYKDDTKSERFEHEDYSTGIFENLIYPLIKDHPDIANNNISCQEIIGLISKKVVNPIGLFCKDIIAGRIDADRMDYLLRDSYYCGVRYGHYEFDRLLNTLAVCLDPDDGGPSIGIKEDGLHAVEGLWIARYMMFHNVYFHKTRVIYDFHYKEALKAMLGREGHFPKPTSIKNFNKYLEWDDWLVFGNLKNGKGGEHGKIICDRNHYRMIFHTNESFENDDERRRAFKEFDQVCEEIIGQPHYIWEEKKSFTSDIPVLIENGDSFQTRPLLELSGVIKSLRPLNQRRLYVPSSTADSISRKLRAKSIGFQEGKDG